MSKSVHVTLSLPEDLKALLYSSVAKGSISKFVSDSLRKSLQEKQEALAQAYMAVATDPGQLEGRLDWKASEGEDFRNVEWHDE